MLRQAIALAMVAGVAHAGEDRGFYVGAGIGQITLKAKPLDFSINATDTAGKIFGGYQINRNLAVEATYIDLGNPKDTDSGLTFGLTANVLQGSLKGIVPFSPVAAGYLKAGIIAWNATATVSSGSSFASADDSSNAFSWGGGVQFNFASNIQGRVEYEGAKIDGIDYQLISAGVSWLFR